MRADLHPRRTAVSAARGALVGAVGVAVLVGGWLALWASIDRTPEGPREWGDTLTGMLFGVPLVLVGAVAAALAAARAVRLPQPRGMVFGASGASLLLARIPPQPVLRVAALLAIFAVAGAVAEAQTVRQAS